MSRADGAKAQQPDGFDFDVFISYCHHDRQEARDLADRLRADGLRVWFDEHILVPGSLIAREIEAGLEKSRVLVLVMSPNAFTSEWTTLERHTYLFRDPTNVTRRFIPLLVTDCKVPDVLRQFHHVDWRTRDGGQYARLLTACRTPGVTLNAQDEHAASADPSDPNIRINPIDGAEMVFVPPGEFLMGDEKRREYLAGYWIYKYPVTMAQYARYCTANKLRTPERPDWGRRADHPVVNVSWHDAAAYCEWAGVVLPTEAQWEKAARGVDGRTFPWGNEWDPSRCQCSHTEWGDAKRTAPVSAHPADVSPYNVRDMAGNVCEWTLTEYDSGVNTNVSSDNARVLRGGAWNYLHESFFRCANRYRILPEGSGDYIGFRGSSGSG